MKTSSRISEAAISTAASARPKAPRGWWRGWLLAVLVLQTLGAGTLLAVPTVQFTTGAETVNASAGAFSVPVTISPAPTATVLIFSSSPTGQITQPRAVVIDAAENTYVTYNNVGDQHSIYKYTPAGAGTQITSSLLDYPGAMAFDAAGNLYIANIGGDIPGTTVCKMTPAGVVTVFASGFQSPHGLAFDAAGNLFVSSNNDGKIYKVTTTGFVSTFASGLASADGLAFDAYGNLYCAIPSGPPAETGLLKFHPLGSSSWLVQGNHTDLAGQSGLAFDPDGNLYVTSNASPNPMYSKYGAVIKITPAGNQSILAGAENFSYPDGIAYYAGNLYVANSLNSSVVNKITLKTNVPYTLGGTAVAGVDYSGITSGSLSFEAGQTSASLNGSLLTNPGPSKTLTFSLGTPDNGAVLGSPSTNTLTIVQPLLPTQLAITAPTVTTIQQAVVTVTVSAVGFVPTGNVTLTVNGVPAVPAALVNGQATFNLGSVPFGSYSLAASYAAQNGYSASTGSGTLTVNKAPSFLFLTQAPNVYREQPIFIVANFGIGQGPNGTRPVQCYTDSSLSTPIPPPTNVGTYFATANFAGDATYLPTSLAESFTIAQAATRIDLTIPASSPFTGSPVAATGVVTFVDDTFGAFGVFIDVGTASFPPTFTYYLASDTGFTNPLAGPPSGVGSYVVVATLAATANYKAAMPQSAAFSIVAAPSLVVTTAMDEDDGHSDPGAGTGTSLREALAYAQSLGGAQTISFVSGLAGQTITLTNGWSGAGDASALVVSAAVTIQGLTGASPVTLAVGAGVPRRHFYVSGTGALTLQNLTLTGGNCPSGGGAIFSQGILNVEGCTFTGNHSAQEGGALWNYGAGTQTQVKNSTFAGNTSVQNGGAISTACELMTLTNVTIADNSITGTVGGGIHQFNGTTRLVNSVVARNTANGSPNNVTSIFNPLDAANSFNNLLGADVAGATGSGLTHGVNGNKVGIAVASLGLGALASNGGLTPTVALLPGSPAVNGGTATGAPTTDQRGKLRPQFGVVDIGAFEQTPFDTGQTIVNVGGGFWYLGPDAVGSDLRVYRELPGQPEVWVDNGSGVRIGQALDGTVLVENTNGEVYARPGSTTGIGTAWPRLTSVVAGDGATWFLGSDGLGSDAYIYRWASGGAPTYSGGFGTQLSVAPNGAIFARNNAGNDYLRVGSDAGLGSVWQIVNQSLVSWRLLHSLPYDGTQDLANPSADGVANLLKYAFNLAPNAGDLARVNVAELPENGTAGLPFLYRDAQGRLVIEFVRRKAATLPGIACIVETGDDLTALQPLNLSGATVVSIDPTWERVTVTDPTVTPERFGRVRVSVVP